MHRVGRLPAGARYQIVHEGSRTWLYSDDCSMRVTVRLTEAEQQPPERRGYGAVAHLRALARIMNSDGAGLQQIAAQAERCLTSAAAERAPPDVLAALEEVRSLIIEDDLIAAAFQAGIAYRWAMHEAEQSASRRAG